ncbi:hypothetical protein AB1Y20_005022 [Prymnesium parvum]|uniref:Uncharacterized protein n=1 Tax=Prymnesium parvum TaxID=97485 RepID=A0AB34J2Z3_PRYPA|mmetsp:Transcript_34083/g.82802  ORF Transcript_34083/g.82802 Transcript_34083/m.82802 type:complete len:90 (+) Transcript_34083:269-538(+)
MLIHPSRGLEDGLRGTLAGCLFRAAASNSDLEGSNCHPYFATPRSVRNSHARTSFPSSGNCIPLEADHEESQPVPHAVHARMLDDRSTK